MQSHCESQAMCVVIFFPSNTKHHSLPCWWHWVFPHQGSFWFHSSCWILKIWKSNHNYIWELTCHLGTQCEACIKPCLSSVHMVLVVLHVIYSVKIKYLQTKFNQVHDKSTGRCPSQNVRCEAAHVRCSFDVQK